MDIPNKQLAFKSMSIDGEIQIKTNSLYPIIQGTTIERWSDDPSIWENNKYLEKKEKIFVPENTTIVITNQSNITKFSKNYLSLQPVNLQLIYQTIHLMLKNYR